MPASTTSMNAQKEAFKNVNGWDRDSIIASAGRLKRCSKMAPFALKAYACIHASKSTDAMA